MVIYDKNVKQNQVVIFMVFQLVCECNRII